MSDGAERRKDLRIPVAARVIFREGSREEVWFTDNISEGGLYLKAEKPPFAGTMVNLEISVPNSDDLIKVKGEVMWRHEGRGCGVRFLRTTAQVRKTIQSFIEKAEEK